MALSGRLVGLLLIGVLLTPLAGWLLIAYAGALLVAVVMDLLLAGRVRDLLVERSESPPARLGVDAQSVLRLHNTGRRRLRGWLRDAWVPSAGATARARLDVPAGGARTLVTELRPTRRGLRTVEFVTIRSGGPLGLAARQRRLAAPGQLRVLPPFTSRRLLPAALLRLQQLDGAVLVQHRGAGTGFDTLRTYVAGDDARSIDWRATARSKDTVVRTWRPERDRQIVLALDVGRGQAARVGDATRLDSAIDAALLVGAVAARAGDRVSLVAADDRIRARRTALAGSAVLPGLVATLGTITASLAETDAAALATEVLRQVRQRSLVVLFADLDTVEEPSALAAIAMLAARHALVIAAVADPRVVELAAARGSASDVYTAAAAETTQARRSTLAARLTRLGARVVDTGPDTFAAQVADAYLDAKATGRL